MHLSEEFFLRIDNKNIIPIIAAGTGCGKSTYIYNKLNKDLGISLSEILVVTHLTSIKDQQTDISSFDFGLDLWGIDKNDDSIQFLRENNRVAKVVNLNRKSYKDSYNDIASVTDYHSMEKFVKSNYYSGVIPNFNKKGIKCIVVDEAHELLMSSNYRSLQYLWHFLMKTDTQVIFLSATPEILLLPKINTFDKKLQLVYSSKSDIPIRNISVYNLKNTRRNKSKCNEIKKLILNNTEFKSFTIINDKKLIQKVVNIMKSDTIGMWSISDNNSKYSEVMDNMRESLIKEERYINHINHMISTNAYGTGINIKDSDIDTGIIFYNSMDDIVQNISRLRFGVKKLIIVKDDISWIRNRLIEEKVKFLNFRNAYKNYCKCGNCNFNYSIISKRLRIQNESNYEPTFVILDNNHEPIINDNFEIVIDYKLKQIGMNMSNDSVWEVLDKYFKYIPEKEPSSDEKDNLVTEFIDSNIKFKDNKAILFTKINDLKYFSLEELKMNISKIYEKDISTTEIRRLLSKLNYNLDKRKSSKTIDGIKYPVYQLYKVV